MNDHVVSTMLNLTHVLTPLKKKKTKVISNLLKEFKITSKDVFGHACDESVFNAKIDQRRN